MTLIIRTVEPADTQQILQFVKELAIYERAEHEAVATEADIARSLFSDEPSAYGLMAEHHGKAIGFAVYFYNYSTWLGRRGLYLEDLYVTPQARGIGAGKALLKRLAEIAVGKQCGRMEWSVLDWNEPAIRFYEAIGAKPQDEWTVYRLAGEGLLSLSGSSKTAASDEVAD